MIGGGDQSTFMTIKGNKRVMVGGGHSIISVNVKNGVLKRLISRKPKWL